MFKKLKVTIMKQLKQGATPEKISQSILLGLLFGCFPIIGPTTLLCIFAGYKLKLNHLVIQVTNHLMYPVQILLIPVYITVIGGLAGGPQPPARPDLIVKYFFQDPLQFLKDYGLIAVYALILWSVLSLIAYLLLQKVFVKLLERMQKKGD